MNIIPLSRVDLASAGKEAMDLWNRNEGFIWPVAPDVMNQNVLVHPGLDLAASFLAYEGKTLAGFLFAKHTKSLAVPAWRDIGWITLFAVDKAYRKQGIGRALVASSLAAFKAAGKTTIQIGRDLENFFPGIPVDYLNYTDRFLANLGFTTHGFTCDMIGRARSDLALHCPAFVTRFAGERDKDALRAFLAKNFPGRWAYEYEEYLEEDVRGEDYLIKLDGDKVIAFARVNDRTSSIHPYNVTWYPRFTNLGGIGPVGVDKDYRKIGLGDDLIVSGLDALARRGIKEVLIDWTGITAFYERFGFEVWKTYEYCDLKF